MSRSCRPPIMRSFGPSRPPATPIRSTSHPTSTDRPPMPIDAHTNLQCLALAARRHGVDLSPERLMHDYAVGQKPVTTRQLLRMAKDAGLRARQTQLTWESLVRLGDAYPLLAELENGNWVVIEGVTAGTTHEMIRVLDPLAQRPEPLLITERQFSNNWRGSVVLIKR